MPVGFGALCRACNSTHRPEIDRRLLAGESTRAVSAWLDTQKTPISHVSLANHVKSHCNVMAEVKAQLIEKAKEVEPSFAAAVAEKIDALETLDEVQRYGRQLTRAVAEKYTKNGTVSVAEAALFGHASKAATQAAKVKHEMLHGKKIEATVTTNADVAKLSDEELQRIIGEGE